MPRQETTPTETPDILFQSENKPLDEKQNDHEFYTENLRVLMPALMSHAGSIMAHSPACEEAFRNILGKQNGIPSYGVYKEQTQRKRTRTEQEESAEGMRF